MTAPLTVALAGPYPASGGMTGTYGRIMGNILQSPVMAAEVSFSKLALTLPAEGSLAKRAVVDLARFRRALRERPSLVHLVMQYNKSVYREWALLRMARDRGIGTVMDIRAGRLQRCIRERHNRLQNHLLGELFRDSDVVLLECPKDVAYVQDRFGRTAIHIPNVMLQSEFDRIQPASLPPGPGEPLRLIYSGRYIRTKGILTVLRSLDILAGRGRPIEFHLTGGGPDAELNAIIRRYVDAPPPGITVVDHGWDVPDLYALLASAHVFVMLTSLPGEGHSLSLTEAMATGLGLILSDWMHRADLMPSEGGLIVMPDDAEGCAAAIETYAHHPEALAQAGAANRRHCREHFLDTVAFPQLLGLYREVAARMGQGQRG
jgi:glycosyltransferase involved in cell wall biosynthesis